MMMYILLWDYMIDTFIWDEDEIIIDTSIWNEKDILDTSIYDEKDSKTSLHETCAHKSFE